MTTSTPVAITVLMPVYNSEKYLKEAIESILNQTFKNFEFLIINDGSSDSSDGIIRSFSDPRITYINNVTNRGIVDALNEGLRISKGTYIARMDADDIATPRRLEIQYQFLNKHSNYKLCGSYAITIDDIGAKKRKIRRPLSHSEIKVVHLFRNAFIHPTIMADASVMKELGYDKNYELAEDYFLFSQIVMQHKTENLKHSALLYRVHDESISAKKLDGMIKNERKTMAYLLGLLFDQVSEDMLATHHFLLRPPSTISKMELEKVESHLINIKMANQLKKLFQERYLEKQLHKEWFETLKRSSEKNKLRRFISSKLFSFRVYNLKLLSKLLFA